MTHQPETHQPETPPRAAGQNPTDPNAGHDLNDPAPDFSQLTSAAQQAMRLAYAPYSEYPVGAAALTTSGEIITGCNIENASYGVGLCAECTLVGQLKLRQAGQLVAFTCVNSAGEYITPCGRCRQLLAEFAAPTLWMKTALGVTTLAALLPESFGPSDLAAAAAAKGGSS